MKPQGMLLARKVCAASQRMRPQAIKFTMGMIVGTVQTQGFFRSKRESFS